MSEKKQTGERGKLRRAKIEINIMAALGASAVILCTIVGFIISICRISANHYIKYKLSRLIILTIRDTLTNWIGYALILFAVLYISFIIVKMIIKFLSKTGSDPESFNKRPTKISDPKIFPKRVIAVSLTIVLCFVVLNIYLYVDSKINTPKGPNIIIILSDALRQDHIGCYGYQRDTTPNIDSFANEAALFTHAYAQSPSTKPSLASMFTSLYPGQHNVIYNENTLPLSCLTLAEVLRENRYITGGFSENIRISGEFGYNQGFAKWNCVKIKRYMKSKEDFDKQILSWLERYHDRPFFLYIHFMEPHSPYTPPPPFANLFDKNYKGIVDGHQTDDRYIPFFQKNRRDLEHLIALYDEEIRFVDFRFGKIIKKLKKLDILENSIIIFLSDHGEEFLDHCNLKHSSSVYSELINIPLIIRKPGLFKQGREEKPVQHIDIFSTLLGILDIEPPDLSLEGTNILEPGAKIIIAEQLRKKGTHMPQRCIITREWKLIHRIDSNSYSLFNILEDPADTKDLIDKYPKIAKALKSYLLNWEKGLTGILKPRRIKLDEKTKKQLRSLGYVH